MEKGRFKEKTGSRAGEENNPGVAGGFGFFFCGKRVRKGTKKKGKNEEIPECQQKSQAAIGKKASLSRKRGIYHD